MEFISVYLGILVIIFILIRLFHKPLATKHPAEVFVTSEAPKYQFTSKKQIMTRAEATFFEKLERVAGNRFYVLPQVHLSTFLNHAVKGQYYKAAFSTINGKSVDFLLVEKALTPIAAIELDDWSHKRSDRIERDERVAEILRGAGILLARFETPNVPDSEIVSTIYNLATATKHENL